MTTLLAKLVTRFSYEVDNSGLKKAERGVENFKRKAVESFAKIAAVLSGGVFINKIAETTDRLGKMADALGMPVQQLQKLQFVAERAGVPVNALTSTLQSLNKIAGSSRDGFNQFGAILGRFGVNLRDSNGNVASTEAIIKKLNVAFQTMSKQEQFDLAQKLGINPEVLPLLQQTEQSFKSLEQRATQLGLVTTENVKRAADFEDQWTNIKAALYSMSVQIFSFAEPALKVLAEAFTTILVKIRTNPILNISAKIIATIAGLAGLITVTNIVIAGVSALGSAVVAAAASVAGIFATAFSAASDVLLGFVAPIAGVVTAIAGIGLVVQDVWGYFHGMNSVTGKVIDKLMKFKIVSESVAKVKSYYKGFTSILSRAESAVESLTKSFEHLFATIYNKVAPHWLKTLVNFLGKTYETKIKVITDDKPPKGALYNKRLRQEYDKTHEQRTTQTTTQPTQPTTQPVQPTTQPVQPTRPTQTVQPTRPTNTLQNRLISNPAIKQTVSHLSNNIQNVTHVASHVVHNTQHVRHVNTTKNQSVNVNVGDISVTAKTEAKPSDIANKVKDVLADSLKQSVNFFDSGVIL